jgi:hypothetical protein
MGRNKLYLLLALACLAGYALLFFSIYSFQYKPGSGFGTCIFKKIAGIPCPSCGSTRAMLLLARGDVYGSLMMNPLAMLSAAIMVAAPLWMGYDLASNKQTLLNSYKKIELTVRVKWISVLLIILVMANWLWNIHKNL